MHRYGFPAGQPAHVLIDLRTSLYDYPGKVLWSRLRVRGRRHGQRLSRNAWLGAGPAAVLRPALLAADHRAECSRTPRASWPTGASRHRRRRTRTPAAQLEGRQLVGAFDFAAAGRSLLVKVAISPVSEESAIANLDAELPGWDFEGVRQAAREAWTRALGVFEVEAPEPLRRSFYTALYHALMAPSLFMDATGATAGPTTRCTARRDSPTIRPTRSGTPIVRCIRCSR